MEALQTLWKCICWNLALNSEVQALGAYHIFIKAHQYMHTITPTSTRLMRFKDTRTVERGEFQLRRSQIIHLQTHPCSQHKAAYTSTQLGGSRCATLCISIGRFAGISFCFSASLYRTIGWTVYPRRVEYPGSGLNRLNRLLSFTVMSTKPRFSPNIIPQTHSTDSTHTAAFSLRGGRATWVPIL